MKINKTRKIIRDQIKKLIIEQEYYFPKAKVIKDKDKIPPEEGEDLGDGRSRFGSVEFEGLITGPWKLARYYTVSNEAINEIYKIESPIPYIYNDLKAYIGKQTFIKMFPYGGKELWETSPKFKKVRNRFGQTVPCPAEVFTEGTKGVSTIGVGHAIKTKEEFKKYDVHSIFNICTEANVKANSQISLDFFLMTDEEIKEIYHEDLIVHQQFKSRIKKPVTQSMFDALTSLAFNAGWEVRHPKKKYIQAIEFIIRLINKGLYKNAQDKLRVIARTSGGKQLQGLVDRREIEATLFGKEGLTPPLKKTKTSVAGLKLK